MTVAALILHELIAVVLLGATTHQVIRLFAPTRTPSAPFVQRLTAVHAESYANVVVACYVANFILGAVLYADYRLAVRPFLESAGLLLVAGAFESKEHVGALGLGLLPAYWLSWRSAGLEQTARKLITLLLTFFVWWNFLVGHIVNNAKGLAS